MGSLLNFVYEKYNIPNGYTFNSGNYIHSAIYDFINELSISKTINFEIKTGYKNIILFEVNHTLDFIRSINGKTILDTIPSIIIDKIIEGNVKLFISSIGEANSIDLDFLNKLKLYLKKYNLAPNHVILLDGNFKLKDLSTEFKIITPLHFLKTEQTLGCKTELDYVSEIISEDEVKNIKSRNKHFISLNRVARNHRIYLLSHLYKMGYLSKFNLSFLNKINDFDDIEGMTDYNQYINELNDILPIRLDTDKHLSIESSFFAGNAMYKKHYLDSYFNITTETTFFENDIIFFSEKILKPILALQPFIVLSNFEYLKYFKSLGFKTFDSIWDESYDNIENPYDRLREIFKIIDKVSKWSISECEEKYKSVLDICIYNRNHLYKNIYDNKEIPNILKEIENEW